MLGTETHCVSGGIAKAELVPVTASTNYAIRVAGYAENLGDMLSLEFDTTETISGTVIDEATLLPIEDITVEILNTPSGGALKGSAVTDVNGDWSAVVPTEDLLVRFRDSINNLYALEYYDDVQFIVDAQVRTVVQGVPQTGIDASLTDAGTMAFTITSSLGSAPLEDATIAVYNEPSGSLSPPVRQGSTLSDGTLTITGLAAGNYVVAINHVDHTGEWYDDAIFWNVATTVVVTAGATANVAAELAAGGKISGTVTDDLGNPLEDVVVGAHRTDGSLAYNDTTDADGLYSISGMTPDTYGVRANSIQILGGAYASEWHDDLPDSVGIAGADKFVVTAGSDATADFSLIRTSVSGTVTDADDALAVEAVGVTLHNDDDSIIDSTTTASDGTYGFTAFAFTGTDVYVSFEPGGLNYDSVASAATPIVGGDQLVIDEAMAVAQVAPQIAASQSFVVSESATFGTVVGTVSASDGNRADTLTYAIVGGNTASAFAIDPSTAAITTAASLDFDTIPVYTLTVEADDGTAPTTADVTVTVTDENEAPSASDATVAIDETAPVGTQVHAVGGTDPDGDSLTYSISAGNDSGLFGLDASTGSITVAKVIDGVVGPFVLTVDVSDGALNAVATITVNITDVPFVVPAANFADVPDTNIFVKDIDWLAWTGVTKGCGTDIFCPAGNVTRGQMAAFLARALNLPATDIDFFTDDNDSIFETDINRLAASGITKGCGTDTYCPGNSVTRGQMAAFLNRALDLPATDVDFFADDDGTTFENDINELAASGITKGCSADSYCANNLVNREQMAAFLKRGLQDSLFGPR